MPRFLSILVAVVALTLPAAAPAQDNSSVDQYTESPPSATGNDGSGPGDGSTGGRNDSGHNDAGGAGGSGSAGGGSLPPATQEALEALGPDGSAAAGLAGDGPRAARSEDGAKRPRGNDQGPARAGAGVERATPDDGEFDTVLSSLTGSGDDGLGIWLPILLGLSLLSAIALMVARRRRKGTEARA